ncbi:mitochondrial metalloendopeptidase OMA1-like protein isoform X1 [Tanacetum coccineum]
MSWYRSSKVGFHAFSRYFTSKIIKTPIKNEIIINQQLNKFLSNRNYFVRVPRPLVVNKSLGFRFFGSYRYDHSRDIVGRYYNSQGSERWSNNHKIVFIVVIVGTGTWVTSKFGYVETIPYTNRKHLILLSQKEEKRLGESYLKKLKDNTYKGNFLPATHPHSVRVTAISRNIIVALQRELKKPNAVLDDMSGQSTNKGKYKREHSAIDYLLGLKWEVMVVNDENVNAFCVPGGKIVVFTGLLKYFTTDEEIVAHAVARHTAEHITKKLWFLITQLILYQYLEARDAVAISDLLLELPFSRRHKARQQDKVYDEREESCWILHLRTGIFYLKGHEGVMNEFSDGAAIFASSYLLRNSDMYRV